MKKVLFLLLATLCTVGVSAQSQIIIPPPMPPVIEVRNMRADEAPIRVTDVNIDLKIVGSVSVTTVEMLFYNPNERVMEGELQFPLGEGQNISRFALDINGTLREGVVVDKAKGQEAFESVIRQKIDPALLEKTEGNNFRARVYPLPAKGSRRIVIAYEQELLKVDNNYRVHLPAAFGNTLDKLNLNIVVYGQSETPKVEDTPWGDFAFSQASDAWVASYKATNFVANKRQLIFTVPDKRGQAAYIESGQISGAVHFYAQVEPGMETRAKKMPRRIAIAWDTSLSMSERNLIQELELLDLYLKRLDNVQVDLYLFNCVGHSLSNYTVAGGNWTALKEQLERVIYDGGTQFNQLEMISAEGADEILLFSDGISNFGSRISATGTVPIHTINSMLQADYGLLQYFSGTTGGQAINLMNQTPANACSALSGENYRLIKAEYNPSQISELTTSNPVIQPGTTFSVAGKLTASSATIQLHFGIGTEVLRTQTITLNSYDAANYNNIVERLWAAKRINELDQAYDQNQLKIEELGRTYNIVTRNTSLIVLDRVEDYVEYRITPPEELIEEYQELLSYYEYDEDNEGDSEWVQQERRRNFTDQVRFWKQDFPLESVRNREKRQKKIRRERYYTVVPLSGEASPRRGYRNQQGFRESEYAIAEVAYMPPGIVGDYEDAVYNASELARSEEWLEESVVVGYAEARDVAYTSPAIEEGENSDLLGGTSMSDARSLEDVSQRVQAMETVASTSARAAMGSMPEQDRKKRPAAIELEEWNSGASYLEGLKKIPQGELYSAYLHLRSSYRNTPSFYLNVAQLFKERGLEQQAVLILTNLVELQAEDYQMMRVLGRKLMDINHFESAITLYERVLELRPEEPQSYRDLALACEANGEYQRAVDLFWEVIQAPWDEDLFDYFEVIAATEMNHTIELAQRMEQPVDVSHIDSQFLVNMPVDLRIVLTWDTPQSDMDLYVTDPKGEECYYGTRETFYGGRLLADYRDGYGPEEFIVKKAIKGDYTIEVNYYNSSDLQTLIGPTTVTVDIFTYYSSGKESKKTLTLQLLGSEDRTKVGTIHFKGR